MTGELWYCLLYNLGLFALTGVLCLYCSPLFVLLLLLTALPVNPNLKRKTDDVETARE